MSGNVLWITVCRRISRFIYLHDGIKTNGLNYWRGIRRKIIPGKFVTKGIGEYDLEQYELILITDKFERFQVFLFDDALNNT